MEQNEALNRSYVEKLKGEYTKLQSGHKINFHELKESLADLNADIDMSSEMDSQTKTLQLGSIATFLQENTNYFEIL